MDIPDRLPFTMQTHTGSPTGYAETAVVMIRGLLEEGVEVHYLCIHDDYIYEAASYDLFVNDIRKVEPEDEPIQVVYSIAPLFFHNSGEYRVGWSMMEVDTISERWARVCNRMDEIWVPTQMNKEAFVVGGCTVPIKVVPLGIDTRAFTPNLLPFVYHGDHTFRFFACGFWQLRKRWDVLIQAFAEEFSHEKQVGLICKTMAQAPQDDIVTQIHQWIGHRCDDQIAIIEGPYPWWEYAMMMRSAHAFVLPTAGEGYGCPPVQALAVGLPVIVTDCMGPGEVLRDEKGKPFPGVRFIAAEIEPCEVTHEYYQGSNWWAPDLADLRKAMREVYENYGKWKTQAIKGSAKVHQERSGAVSARAIKRELTRIYGKL